MSDGSRAVRVVMCADYGYALPLAVAGCSFAQHRTAVTDRLTVVDCGLSTTVRDALSRIWADRGLAADFLDPGARRWEGLGGAVRPWISNATYARLLLPDIRPADWERTLYLDVDVVVMTPLDDLFRMPMEGHAIAAARDYGIPFVAARGGVQDWARYGGDPIAPYCNAGVLLIDLDAVRREGLFEQAWQYCVESAHLQLWADQEALNAVLGGRFLELDQSWNALYYWARDELAPTLGPDLLTRTRIRHFAGARKPWAHRPGEEPWGVEAWTTILDSLTPEDRALLGRTLPSPG